MFQNVEALQLPALLDGLDVSEAAADQVEGIIRATGLLPAAGRTFYVVAGSNYHGYVVAGVVVSSEDEGEYFDESLLWPGTATA
jgi:hypothetical protein